MKTDVFIPILLIRRILSTFANGHIGFRILMKSDIRIRLDCDYRRLYFSVPIISDFCYLNKSMKTDVFIPISLIRQILSTLTNGHIGFRILMKSDIRIRLDCNYRCLCFPVPIISDFYVPKNHLKPACSLAFFIYFGIFYYAIFYAYTSLI